MPPRKSQNSGADGDQQGDSTGSELALIGNLLALGLIQGKPQEDQIALLAAAGYPTGKIALMLETTRNTVSVTLSKRRSAGKAKAKGKR